MPPNCLTRKNFKIIITMKISKIIAATLIAAIAAASCSSNGGASASASGADSTVTVKPVNPKSLLPKKGEIDSVSYYIGLNFGSFIKNYDFAENLGDLNFGLIKKGIEDLLKAKGNFGDSTYNSQFKYNPEAMNEIFNNYLGSRREYKTAVNKEKEAKFLAANAKKDSVKVSESGLQYIIGAAGNDVKPGTQDTVYVHYKGTLTDGTVFDQSPKNDTGVRMNLNRVIKGWTEGLQLIGEGGKIKLFVPSELGYGENGTRGIEPNSTLVFDIELIKVCKFVPKEETKK